MKNNTVVYLICGLLIVGAFLIGRLSGENKYLKGDQEIQVKGVEQEMAPEGVPPTLAPVSMEQMQELIEGAAARKGNEDAPVKIVEFTEYQCPFCNKYYEEAYQQILSDYVETGKVEYALRDLPLPFHNNAQKTSEAARCAGESGKYWEMHGKLFENQEEWSELAGKEAESKFTAYGRELGVEIGVCLTEGKFAQAVKDDTVLAGELGVSGTPSFLINGQRLVGAQPFESFKTAIENYL